MHPSLVPNPVRKETVSPVNCGAPREEAALNSPTGNIAAFDCGSQFALLPREGNDIALAGIVIVTGECIYLPRSPLRAEQNMRRVLDYGLILTGPVDNDLYLESHVAMQNLGIWAKLMVGLGEWTNMVLPFGPFIEIRNSRNEIRYERRAVI
jgi:hypothetical protein